MLVPSRRFILAGMGSLVVAPALVKADSLMKLRGPLLDPWVIGCLSEAFEGRYFLSNCDPSLDHLFSDTPLYESGIGLIYEPGTGLITEKYFKSLNLKERFEYLNRTRGNFQLKIIRKSELLADYQ